MANAKYNKYGMPSNWSKVYCYDRPTNYGHVNPEPEPITNKELYNLGTNGMFERAHNVWVFQYRGVELTLTLTREGWHISHPTLGIRALIARETPIIQMRDELRELITSTAPAWMLKAEDYNPLAWIGGNNSGVAGEETVGQPGDWLTDNLPETAELAGPGGEYGLSAIEF